MNVEMIASHCNWYFDLIPAITCFIDVIHLTFGSITHVFSHFASANRTQLVLGSICRNAFTSFCSVISLTISIIMCLILVSSFLIIQLYNIVIISSNVLSVVNTPLEVIRFHLSSNNEKKSHILSSALYLV
ncbi:hypothetical protein J6V86_02860 [bacterium]|nr:hypothetical protein [bacterium]